MGMRFSGETYNLGQQALSEISYRGLSTKLRFSSNFKRTVFAYLAGVFDSTSREFYSTYSGLSTKLTEKIVSRLDELNLVISPEARAEARTYCISFREMLSEGRTRRELAALNRKKKEI